MEEKDQEIIPQEELTLDIPDQQMYLKFVGQHMEEEDTEIIPQEELTLEIPVLDQYVHILAERQKAWRLQNCFVVFLSDFELIKGNLCNRQ